MANGVAHTGLPYVLCILLMLVLASLCALFWGIPLWLVRLFAEKHGWPVGLTLGPAWMFGELGRNYFITGLPWVGLGYSQARHLWLAQLASVGGVYVASFGYRRLS